MKRLIPPILCFGYLLSGLALWAHSPAETHTDMQMKDGQLLVVIEFPWTIAGAVKSGNKISDSIGEKALFWQLLRKYLQDHFIIRQSGLALSPAAITKQEGMHDHSALIQIVYEIHSWEDLEIENTLLFDINKKQQNYHQVFLGDRSFGAKTTHSNANIQINDWLIPQNQPFSGPWVLVLVCLALSVWVLARPLLRSR